MAWRVPGYEPLARLGRGSAGAVTSARDSVTGSVVAITYLSKDILRQPGLVERYRAEAPTLALIEHPNVGQVFEFAEGPGGAGTGGAAVVTELVQGVTLRRLLAPGPLDPKAALLVLKGALIGLGQVHGRGIVHRDVTPETLMVHSSGVIKLVGVGLPSQHGRPPTPGTPPYQAPEVADGQPATGAADVYAMTAVLFEALSGQPLRVSANRPADVGIAAITPGQLPGQIRALLTAGLSTHPATRPAQADAMLNALLVAAFSAYGAGWEENGRSALLTRLTAVTESGSPGEAARLTAAAQHFVARVGTHRIVIAAAIALLVGLGGLTLASGAFAPAEAVSPDARASSHVPVVEPGPTVPGDPPAGSTDTVSPIAPTGLHVTSRSQSAVSLDWNPATDNVKVAGYVVARDGVRIGTTYNPGFTDPTLAPKTRYAYTVTAFDAAGNLSPAGAPVVAITLAQPDTAPPTVPADVHSTGRTTTTVVLAWSPSADNVGVAGYDVFRNGSLVGTVPRAGFTDTGLNPNTTYGYQVRAFDSTYKTSALSVPPAMVTTLSAPDRTPPSSPLGVSATPTSATSVSVSWRAATDNVGVTGYVVLRRVGSAWMPVVTTPNTSYLDSAQIEPSKRYSYAVVALDAAGNRSAPGGPVDVTTPAEPTPTPTPTVDPTTPPPAEVLSLSVSASSIAAPACTVTVTVTATVSGPVTVNVTGGGAGVQALSFPTSGSQDLTFDGTVNGSVTVSAPAGIAPDQQASWTAPAECLPPPPSPTDTPTAGVAGSASSTATPIDLARWPGLGLDGRRGPITLAAMTTLAGKVRPLAAAGAGAGNTA